MVAIAENVTPIGGVQPGELMQVWDRVEPILARVVKPQTGFTLDSVLTRLQYGDWQLWVIGNFQAVAVTEIDVRPLHKVLWCRYIAGDNIDEWLADWEALLVEFARHHDCKAVEFSGRKGWNKFKGQYDEYKQVLTTWRKELED